MHRIIVRDENTDRRDDNTDTTETPPKEMKTQTEFLLEMRTQMNSIFITDEKTDRLER